MLVLDANLWVAAFDPSDRFHDDSVTLFRTSAARSQVLAGPSFVVLESVCALGRRIGDPQKARAAGAKMTAHPSLHFEPVTEALLAEALRLGLDHRLRGPDALYAATAVRLGCPLLSWDLELLERGGALSPSDWLAANP